MPTPVHTYIKNNNIDVTTMRVSEARDNIDLILMNVPDRGDAERLRLSLTQVYTDHVWVVYGPGNPFYWEIMSAKDFENTYEFMIITDSFEKHYLNKPVPVRVI